MILKKLYWIPLVVFAFSCQPDLQCMPPASGSVFIELNESSPAGFSSHELAAMYILTKNLSTGHTKDSAAFTNPFQLTVKPEGYHDEFYLIGNSENDTLKYEINNIISYLEYPSKKTCDYNLDIRFSVNGKTHTLPEGSTHVISRND